MTLQIVAAVFRFCQNGLILDFVVSLVTLELKQEHVHVFSNVQQLILLHCLKLLAVTEEPVSEFNFL